MAADLRTGQQRARIQGEGRTLSNQTMPSVGPSGVWSGSISFACKAWAKCCRSWNNAKMLGDELGCPEATSDSWSTQSVN